MRRCTGVSLIELSAVVAILGIIAMVVIPSFASTDRVRLELAANKVAEALRFARSEAMRNGALRGVLVDTGDTVSAAKDIAVFVPDSSTSPFGIASFVPHPLSRQPYNLRLDDQAMPHNVTFANGTLPFSFQGVVGARSYLFFDAEGTPVWLADGALSRFTTGSVKLALGGGTLTVTVAPVTGRVRLQ